MERLTLLELAEKLKEYARAHDEQLQDRDNTIKKLREENAQLRRRLAEAKANDGTDRSLTTPTGSDDRHVGAMDISSRSSSLHSAASGKRGSHASLIFDNCADDLRPAMCGSRRSSHASLSRSSLLSPDSVLHADLSDGNGEHLQQLSSANCRSRSESHVSSGNISECRSGNSIDEDRDVEMSYQQAKKIAVRRRKSASFDDTYTSPLASPNNIMHRAGEVASSRRGRGPLLPSWSDDASMLSPDIQERVDNKIQREICEQYAGLLRTQRAASTIQRCYRNYRLLQHIKHLRIKSRRKSITSESTPMANLIEGGNGLNVCIEVSGSQLSNPGFLSKSSRSNSVVSLDAISGTDVTFVTLPHATSESRLSSNSMMSISQGQELESELTMVSEPSDRKDRNAMPFEVMRRKATTSSSSLSKDRVEQHRLLRIGIHHFNRKPIKGVQYLIQKGLLNDSAYAVARFLRRQNGLARSSIGEYLGYIQNPFCVSVLKEFAKTFDFRSMQFVQALRAFMATFRIPGEAQKIDKILEVFAAVYSSVNASGPVKNPDTALILAFSTLMLNTDLHNTSIKRHMTKDEFIRNNRGLDQGMDLPREFLESIYDDIHKNEFKTNKDPVQQVLSLEKNITGLTSPLAQAHRHLVHVARVFEIGDPEKKQNLTAHSRFIFIFNDLLLVAKFAPKKNTCYAFRTSYPLLGMKVSAFSNQFYKHAFQLSTNYEEKVVVTFNAESDEAVKGILRDLKEVLAEIVEMEEERIQDIGRLATKRRGSTSSSLSNTELGVLRSVSVTPLGQKDLLPEMTSDEERELYEGKSRSYSNPSHLSEEQPKLPSRTLPRRSRAVQDGNGGVSWMGSIRRGNRKKKSQNTINNPSQT